MQAIDRRNPYVGPSAYKPSQADLFFGRDREAKKLISLIRTNEIVLFYARSGAGKTSLINARIVPGLVDRGFQVLPPARVGLELPRDSTPSNPYIFNVLSTIGRNQPNTSRLEEQSLDGFLASELSDDDRGHTRAGMHRILILDQFEEILTTHPAHWDKRDDFFLQIKQALAGPALYSVVFVMREDHIAGLDRFAPLLPNRLRTRFRMERFRYENAVTAIRRPAERANRPFAENVAEALADNLCQENIPGQEESVRGEFIEPVQLQVFCFQLWESLGNEWGDEITRGDVERFGDVDRALETFYDETLRRVAEKTPVTEDQLRRWFGKALITRTGRRQQVLREDEEAGGLPNRAVTQLIDEHLIRSVTTRGGIWLELIHDRFVDPVLASNEKWLPAEQKSLATDARAWRQADRDASFLYHGRKLEAAKAWVEDYGDAVDALDREFLKAAKEAKDQRAMRRKKRLGYLVTGAILVLLTTVTLALVALDQAQKAKREADLSLGMTRAIAALELLKDDPPRGLQQALDAARVSTVTPLPRIVLRRALQASRARLVRTLLIGNVDRQLALDGPGNRLSILDSYLSVWDVESGRKLLVLPDAGRPPTASTLSTDGTALAAALDDGTLQIWDVDSRQMRHSIAAGVEVLGLLISPDGSHLAAISFKGKVGIWDARSGGSIVSLSDPEEGSIIAGNFGPEGRRLATINEISGSPETANPSNRLAVWDLESGLRLHASPSTGALAVSFSPSGRSLAVVGSDGVQVWDVAAGLSPGLRLLEESPIYSVVFGQGDRYVALASIDGTARIWDPENNKSYLAVPGDRGLNVRPAFSLDGRRLAIARERDKIEIWEMIYAEVPRTLSGHGGRINAVVAGRGGKLLASGGDDRTARIWDLESGQLLESLRGHQAPVNGVAFSPDHRRLATASDRTVRIWKLESGELERTLEAHSKLVTAVAWSPDGASIVTASTDGEARVWGADDGDLRRTLPHSGESVLAIAFSPNGRLLATAGGIAEEEAGIARIWDARSGGEIARLKAHSDLVTAVAFSPDGKLLATGSDDKTARTWETRPAEPREPPLRLSGTVTGVAFAPGSKLLATCDINGAIVLWDVDSGAKDFTVPNRFPIRDLAFTPDGEHLATGSDDGRIRLEPLAAEDLIRLAEERASAVSEGEN